MHTVEAFQVPKQHYSEGRKKYPIRFYFIHSLETQKIIGNHGFRYFTITFCSARCWANI